MNAQNNTNTNQSVKKLTMAGVLAAAIVLLTSVVSIPMPGGFGYINLGDAGVLLAGALLGGGWGRALRGCRFRTFGHSARLEHLCAGDVPH